MSRTAIILLQVNASVVVFIGNTFGVTMTAELLRNKHSDIFIYTAASETSEV